MVSEKRLIDANVTEKVMNERYKALAAEYGHYDHYTTGYGDALCVVEDAPTVDAVEVVHGRWIPLEYDGYADGNPVWDLWECSECQEEHSGDEDTLTPYCPFCGAKMDGGNDDV